TRPGPRRTTRRALDLAGLCGLLLAGAAAAQDPATPYGARPPQAQQPAPQATITAPLPAAKPGVPVAGDLPPPVPARTLTFSKPAGTAATVPPAAAPAPAVPVRHQPPAPTPPTTPPATTPAQPGPAAGGSVLPAIPQERVGSQYAAPGRER